MAETQDKLIILSDEEMESKFEESGMPAILKTCKATRTDRDPAIITNPPNTSVKHKRERGLRYSSDDGTFRALIFEWDGPDGTPHKSIRQFVTDDGLTYRRKLRFSKS